MYPIYIRDYTTSPKYPAAVTTLLKIFFIDDLSADSLDQVELIMAFKEEFGAEIPDKDVEKLTIVGSVIKYLQEKGISAE